MHVTDLSCGLVQLGHDVHVVCRKNGEVPNLLANKGVCIHRLPLRGGLDFKSIVSLAALVRREQYDILHAHTGRDYTLCHLAHRLARRGQIVFSRHLLKVNRPRWLARRNYSSAACTITVSEAIRRRLIRDLALPPKLVVTIPNWLDVKQFSALLSPDEVRCAYAIETRFTIGVIGSIIPIKGQEDFLRAAALVIQKFPDTTFLVIGNNRHGDKAYFSKLHTLRQDLGLGEHLRFIDWVKDIRLLLPALTISVVPSWHDAFSLVTIESMAAGVPVVAAAEGGPAEIIEHEVNGLLFKPRDVDALASAICRLLCNKKLREKYSVVARKTIVEHFDRQCVISRITALYQEILGQS